ncbi:hypothetical protein [Pontibacter harenae]|uniref:hypothetical protein n=1 Tax=Pontibacter harenae TaxID=2894083 RepID=UPI001E6235FB|nr:hypothetical protein [Pontibacter harenae]MCC9165302.1 hypothetical protein [Pontibacter harenae]
MSELSNPLFDSERELLERQKEEYKNALMGDVDTIKTQSQEIGKKVAIAGGVLLVGALITRAFSGGSSDSKKKKKQKSKSSKEDKSKLEVVHVASSDMGTNPAGYNSFSHDQEDDYTLSSERMPHAHHDKQPKSQKDKKSKSNSFFKSDVAKAISQQLMALAVVYATKKVEEYLSSVSENNDIAADQVEVTEIETTEYIIPEKDAI